MRSDMLIETGVAEGFLTDKVILPDEGLGHSENERSSLLKTGTPSHIINVMCLTSPNELVQGAMAFEVRVTSTFIEFLSAVPG